MLLAHFEPVGTRFGPWKIPKCLENGPFWDQKWVKNGSKMGLSKRDPGPFRMLKQVFLAHFEAMVTHFGPWKTPQCLEKGLCSEHVAQDTARSWFWACLTETAHIQAIFSHFWAISQTYRGVQGHQRALGHRAIKAHVKCSNHFPSLGRYDWVSGPFLGQKRLFWGTKCAVLGGHLPTWRPRPGVPPLIFG